MACTGLGKYRRMHHVWTWHFQRHSTVGCRHTTALLNWDDPTLSHQRSAPCPHVSGQHWQRWLTIECTSWSNSFSSNLDTCLGSKGPDCRLFNRAPAPARPFPVCLELKGQTSFTFRLPSSKCTQINQASSRQVYWRHTHIIMKFPLASMITAALARLSLGMGFRTLCKALRNSCCLVLKTPCYSSGVLSSSGSTGMAALSHSRMTTTQLT